VSESVVVASVEQAVDALELVKVEFYAIEARRNEEYVPLEDEDDHLAGGETAIRTAYRRRDDGLDFRVSITLEEPWGRVEADGAVIYAASENVEFEPRAIKDFGEMVAAMTIFPYLREAITSASERIGVRVVLPLIKRGVIEFAVSGVPSGEPDSTPDGDDSSE